MNNKLETKTKDNNIVNNNTKEKSLIHRLWEYTTYMYIGIIVYGGVNILVNKYVVQNSKQYTSIEEIQTILPEEKKRLGIEEYIITLNLEKNMKTSSCEYIGPKNYNVHLTKEQLNLGVLRHELKHSTRVTQKKIHFIRYTLIEEPIATYYSLSALNK